MPPPRPFKRLTEDELPKWREAYVLVRNHLLDEIHAITNEKYWKPKHHRAMWGAHLTIAYAIVEAMVIELAEEQDARNLHPNDKYPPLKLLTNPLVDASGNPVIASTLQADDDDEDD